MGRQCNRAAPVTDAEVRLKFSHQRFFGAKARSARAAWTRAQRASNSAIRTNSNPLRFNRFLSRVVFNWPRLALSPCPAAAAVTVLTAGPIHVVQDSEEVSSAWIWIGRAGAMSGGPDRGRIGEGSKKSPEEWALTARPANFMAVS